MLNRLVLLVLVCGLATGCGSCPPKPNPNDPHPVEPVTEADCKTTCDHFRALGCSEGKPTANGVECEEVCGSMPSSPDYLKCATAIGSCVNLADCPRP